MRKLASLGIRVEPEIDSNIVIFRLSEGAPPLPLILSRLKEAGVLMGGMCGGIRAVTHSQVTSSSVHTSLKILYFCTLQSI